MHPVWIGRVGRAGTKVYQPRAWRREPALAIMRPIQLRPWSLFEVHFLHQRYEARLRAQWIEDTIHLNLTHPFRMGSVGLLQIVQRALALAHTEIDYRQVKRRNISVQGLMLHLLNHRAGLN